MAVLEQLVEEVHARFGVLEVVEVVVVVEVKRELLAEVV